MKYVFLSLSVLFNIIAYMIFKSITGMNNKVYWFLFFIIGLIIAFVVWITSKVRANRQVSK